MRRALLTSFFALLAGCEGEILTTEPLVPGPVPGRVGGGTAQGGGPGTGAGTASTPFDATIACDPSASPLQPTAIRRLSKKQFTNSLHSFFSKLSPADRATLMASIDAQLAQLPDDHGDFGERNDTVLSQSHVDAVFDIATSLGTTVAASSSMSSALLSMCAAGATLANATCLSQAVDALGLKALRRPLTTSEKADFVSFTSSLSATDALPGLVARLLLHPRFYYELDLEGAQRAGTEGIDATYELTSHEFAHKLTFFLWNAPPDDALLAKVPTTDRASLVSLVVDDARTRDGLGGFYAHWLDLQRTPNLPSVSSAAFTTFAGADAVGQPGHHHREEMMEEVLSLGLHYTLDADGTYADLLTSPYSFAKGADLAKLYGVPAWNGDAHALVPFPAADGRSGLLTTAALLVSGGEYTRPIIKGERVRRQILCDEMPPPPASLQIKPLEQNVMKSTRTVVEEATGSATCQGCHSQMNPLGFVTEGFDALGRARTAERKFNTDGSAAGTVALQLGSHSWLYPGDEASVDSPQSLAARVLETGKGEQCFAKQAFRYAHGRKELPTDGCDLETLRTRLTQGNLKSMFTELVQRDSFTQRTIR